MKYARLFFVLLWTAAMCWFVSMRASFLLTGRPKFKTFPRYENRDPEPYPKFRELKTREWGRAFDAWYNDAFSARTELVELHSSLMLGTLKSPVGRDVPGEGDWSFRRGNDWAEVDDYLGAFEWTPEETEQWVTLFEGRVEWARAHGSQYIEYINATKAYAHPEKLFRPIRVHRGRSTMEQLKDALRDSPARDHVLFNCDEMAALAAGGTEAFYHKDHHPSPAGMWVQYDTLNRRMAQMLGRDDMQTPPFYAEGEVPEAVLAGKEPGCWVGPNERLAVSNPGSGMADEPDRLWYKKRYPYTDVVVTNSGPISVVMVHDSFMRFSLESWKDDAGEVVFPFPSAVGRVEAHFFRRWTTGSLMEALAAGVPDFLVEQMPIARLNLDIVGLDGQMRRAAAFSRAKPIESGSSEGGPVTVLARFKNPAPVAEGEIQAHLREGGEDLDQCALVYPGEISAVYFRAECKDPSALEVILENGTADSTEIEIRR